MRSFILVHSPVAGPATWRWVAQTLTGRGHRVTVPAVPAAVTSQGWEAFADAVAAQSGQADHAVLVGHSGAGPLLPQIQARARGQADALVFVDASVPPEAGQAGLMPGGFLTELRAMARDGLLPAFSDWFGPDVMAELIPDEGKRAIVTRELPRLPASFFESRVPEPAGWASARCGYVQLSESYAGEAAEAASRGWPILQRPGAHFDLVTRPVQITDAILSVTGRLADRPNAVPRPAAEASSVRPAPGSRPGTSAGPAA